MRKMPRAFDPCRVERLLGHVANPGEIEDHRQPGERPAADDRERVDRDAIVAEPLADHKPEAEGAQHAVERAENRVEDQEEHQSHRDERHRHRKEYRRSQKGREIDRARAHRVGDEKSENDRESQRDREPLQIVLKRDIKIFVAEHVGVIGEADELLDRRHAVPFEEAQIDRVDDRIADKAEEKDDRQHQSENCDEDMLARECDEGRSFVAHPRSHCDSPVGKRGGLASKPLLRFPCLRPWSQTSRWGSPAADYRSSGPIQSRSCPARAEPRSPSPPSPPQAISHPPARPEDHRGSGPKWRAASRGRHA